MSKYKNIIFDELLTNENDDILVELSSKSCLDAMSGNELNEKNVAADDLNGLAYRKFTLIMKLVILGECESSTPFSNT